MKKIVLLALMSISLLGCGSDSSRPGVMPGIPGPIKPSYPTNPNPSNPTTPPIDSNNPPQNPNGQRYELLSGIYSGLTGQRELAQGLVDDNKRLWVIYSDENLYADGNVLGFVNSNGGVTGNSGEFNVQGKNYSYDAKAALDTTITGNYKQPNVIKGQVYGLPINSTSYELIYNEPLSNVKQSLASINRVFTGTAYITNDTEAGDLTLRIGANGLFTGEDESGCRMSGKFTLSVSKRYFDSIVTFGGYPCYAPRETITGVALLNEDNDLIVVGTDVNRSKGIFFSSAE